MTCFDCKVCFGSKFTSSAEGRRFNWLIYDSMTSLSACGRFSKSRGLSASVSFLPSFPFPFPLFYSLHSSPRNSLLPNCTETLAMQANAKKTSGLLLFIDFEKAFDSLEWDFMNKALNAFNFGPNVKRWITIFYKGVQSAVMNGGF